MEPCTSFGWPQAFAAVGIAFSVMAMIVGIVWAMAWADRGETHG